jgi:hypothetical protein
MSFAGKIRRVQAEPYLVRNEEMSRRDRADIAVRSPEIKLVGELLDKVEAAVAVCDYTAALQFVEECVVAYASAKKTSREEAMKNLGLVEIIAKLKENSTTHG